MAFLYSSNYGLTRVNNSGPDVKGWSATDLNFEVLGDLFKTQELHRHNNATPILYPGYNYATPVNPATPTLTISTSGGSLSPGITVGVRLAYVNSIGLETQGSPEAAVTLAAAPTRANAPQAGPLSATPVFGSVPGGTYAYGITKRRRGLETQTSNLTIVNVPYSSVGGSYNVLLTFDNFNTYTDGTDSLCIYRATGLSSAMQLLAIIGDGTVTTYTDNNTIADANQSPPTANQFNKTNLLTIDWSGITVPPQATKFRIYVTQQSGVWNVNHLLAELATNNPSTPLGHSYTYAGTEVLSTGWPKEISQLMANPGPVNLRTEAFGGFTLTDYANFNGYQSWNFVLANNVNQATPINGAMYYEPSMPAFRFYINGWQSLTTPNGSYVHPTQEQGGHLAGNIKHGAGGPDVSSVLDLIALRTATPFRKQVTGMLKAPLFSMAVSSTTSAATPIPDMVTTLTPTFAGQWGEFTFNADIACDTSAAVVNANMKGNGLNLTETQRSWTVPSSNAHLPFSMYFATPLSAPLTIQVQWWNSSGIASIAYPQRTLVGKLLF